MNDRAAELERIAEQYHLNDTVPDKFIEDICQEHCCDWLQSLIAPDHMDVHSIRRLEGASDPSDMVGVLAIICPVCDNHATVVLKFGPEASPDEIEIWQRTKDLRESSTLDGHMAPGENDPASVATVPDPQN